MSDEPIIGRVEAQESPKPPPLPAYVLLEWACANGEGSEAWNVYPYASRRRAESHAANLREIGSHTALIRLDAPAPERAPVLDVERARRIIPTLRDESRGPQGGGE